MFFFPPCLWSCTILPRCATSTPYLPSTFVLSIISSHHMYFWGCLRVVCGLQRIFGRCSPGICAWFLARGIMERLRRCVLLHRLPLSFLISHFHGVESCRRHKPLSHYTAANNIRPTNVSFSVPNPDSALDGTAGEFDGHLTLTEPDRRPTPSNPRRPLQASQRRNILPPEWEELPDLPLDLPPHPPTNGVKQVNTRDALLLSLMSSEACFLTVKRTSTVMKQTSKDQRKRHTGCSLIATWFVSILFLVLKIYVGVTIAGLSATICKSKPSKLCRPVLP